MPIPNLDQIREAEAAWRDDVYDKAQAKSGERRESFSTSSVEVEPRNKPTSQPDSR